MANETNTTATGMGEYDMDYGIRFIQTHANLILKQTSGPTEKFVVERTIQALASQPAPVVGNELYNLVAQAIRSTGMVTNTDKWEVAESVITALSCRYGWKDEDRG